MNNLGLIAGRILSWYALNKRDLPWRHTKDPYFIWVSEVMLQQTQVDTVIPYYQRFLSKFPTIEALAKAPLQEVLKVWENMGYYGRARHLHKAAREIVNHGDSEIPRTWDALMRLPGIGGYTASAILSFAFDQRFPTVDGNARRVLSRLFCIQGQIDQNQTQQKIHELAVRMIPQEDPASFNHGIMELGATICKPRGPSCNICPLPDLCMAFEKGLQGQLPAKKKRKPLPQKDGTAAIIEDKRGRLLIVQRLNNGLLGGLWKFPGGLKEPQETLQKGLRRCVREELGIGIRVKEAVTSVDHAYTHFRIRIHAFRCVKRDGKPKAMGCERYRWLTRDQLNGLPFSRADRKVIEAL